MSSETPPPGVPAPGSSDAPAHQPFVPATETIPEFTWPTLLTGVVLGIIFGASSLYLVLKVGLTVSASVPIAVLSITLFRAFSKDFGVRKTTILENNIVQTTGSAGESIAFGVGVTMPALLLLGFEMDPIRVMTVSVLGAILGILMMIPLRRAFIVKQHGKLIYPEGTACAEVLVAGEKGGATAKMVFVGFGIALVHKFLGTAAYLWAQTPSVKLYTVDAATGAKSGLKGAGLGGELAPELIGVGYLIGPRIACLMFAGAVLSYFALAPAIATFGESQKEPLAPAKWDEKEPKDDTNPGLIRNMSPGDLKNNYVKYIGAGAVAAGGIISMCRALPLIFASIGAGYRDLRASRGGAPAASRTEHDMPITVVIYGSLALVLILAAVPQLGLGLNPLVLLAFVIICLVDYLSRIVWKRLGFLKGPPTMWARLFLILFVVVVLWAEGSVAQTAHALLGAALVLLFGFLFVTVSSRLTGEVGSSSNPISGMTIATILLVCLIFLILGRTGPTAMLTALTISAVVCIASSNGGTTSQDLKTGFLVGATPSKQQWAILIGSVTSALVIGLTMLALNKSGTHYTKHGFPTNVVLNTEGNEPTQKPGKPYDRDQDAFADGKDKDGNEKTNPGWKADAAEYRVVHVRQGDYDGKGDAYKDLEPGRYLVSEKGNPVYRADVPIDRQAAKDDAGNDAPKDFSEAPQPTLFANIIKGILGGTLQWSLIITGVMIAIALELCGIAALPVAVGMYLSLASTTPIFIGGMVRLLADKLRGKPKTEAESETSPGVLLASGFIAGGTLCGLVIAFFAFLPDSFNQAINLGFHAFATEVKDAAGNVVIENGKPKLAWKPEESGPAKVAAVVMFLALGAYLLWVGSRKETFSDGKPQRTTAMSDKPGLEPEDKKRDIPWGVAGLILVLLRLLLALQSPKDIGDVFWFVRSVGGVASFVGLIISVIGIFKNSGRISGIAGVVAFVVLVIAFWGK